MARQIIAIEPLEWRDRSWKSRIDIMTKLFIMRCTNEPLFSNGRLSTSYFKIRNFFRSKPNDEVAMIYDFVFTLQFRTVTDLTNIYMVSEIYRKKLLHEAEQRKVKELSVYKYKDITIGDVLEGW